MTSSMFDDAALGIGTSPPLVARMLNKLTSPKSGPALMLKGHRWLYMRTDGRIGPGMIGAWTLLLHTTGRRTGQPRISALVFARDGARFILAASNDGKDWAPAWFHNLRSNPAVELQVGRHHLSGQAIIIERSEPNYTRLWELMNATNHGRYNWYQSKTSRPIPLVVITP
jgi:deazaflavin-dependent oxidoreductase (nitroreductase family)